MQGNRLLKCCRVGGSESADGGKLSRIGDQAISNSHSRPADSMVGSELCRTTPSVSRSSHGLAQPRKNPQGYYDWLNCFNWLIQVYRKHVGSGFHSLQYQQGDTEGVVNYALSIQNVALAALFTERDDRIRVSLRSKGEFNVNEFARAHFSGGGHRNAAGGDVFKSMPDTLNWFQSLLPEISSQIHQSLANYK